MLYLTCECIFYNVSPYLPLFMVSAPWTFQYDINLKTESLSQFNKLGGQFRHDGITLS